MGLITKLFVVDVNKIAAEARTKHTKRVVPTPRAASNWYTYLKSVIDT